MIDKYDKKQTNTNPKAVFISERYLKVQAGVALSI
jgi:hypothetical protein